MKATRHLPPLLRSPLVLSLVGLNALLLAGLAWRHLPTQAAEAQAPAPGDYLMLAGEADGINGQVVYIHDTRNGGVLPVALDASTGLIDALPPVNVNQVLDNAGGIR